MTAAAPQIQAPPTTAAAIRAPRPRRVTQYIVLAVVLIFALGHLWDIVTFQEHWPYSRYSMYSTTKPKKTQVFEGDPKTAAAQLVEKLKFEARVL